MAMETKERAPLSWPAPLGEGCDPDPHGVPPDPDAVIARTRAAVAAEWRAANPQTPEEIAAFYATAQGLAADLAAWHARPDRQEATRMLVHVAQQSGAHHVVDIGCGAGHDLLALMDARPRAYLEGVEPNRALRASLVDRYGLTVRAGVHEASIERADLLVCIDVLEHVPDPELVLGAIAQRAPLGCLLVEAVATSDLGTPLHLPANAGWKPGRVLERHGWELADQSGRVRVWRREAEAGAARAGLLLCAYRGVSVDSLASLMALCAGAPSGNRWRLKVKAGDALIARSRAVLLTEWWRSTNDDVALMVDDDLAFAPGDADHIAQLCRGGYDVICGAYPVRNGAHLALRTLEGTSDVRFGPDEPPLEVRWPATGFMALSRRVVDALIAGAADGGRPLPLCHPRESWSFYNLFPTMVIADGDNGHVLLSEDWGFGELARRAGFPVWLDPTVRLQHASAIPVSVANMAAVHAAIAHA